jgi:prepilin peptidase CpaA
MIAPYLLVAWFVTILLVVAAVIDGRSRRVPNWLTFPMALAGLVVAFVVGGPGALGTSAAGLALGLALLLPLYSIGGMGAGDVKLLAALGAWTGPYVLLMSFVVGVLVGGVMAMIMIFRSGRALHHVMQAQEIANEVMTIRDPVRLSELAAARKPKMMLLPYGVPLTIGAVGYFAYVGLLF